MATFALVAGFVVYSSGVLQIRGEELHVASGDVQLAATLALPRSPGPHPAAVIVHGSGRVDRRMLRSMAGFLARNGIAALAYDKRGVGESGGQYPTFNVADCRPLLEGLTDDLLAAVAYLRTRDDIDHDRIGLYGGSQAGWIMPLAASRGEIAFIVSISGPAVSCGEEDLYSRLTGDDPGPYRANPLSSDEIRRRMEAFAGPHGFRPAEILASLDVPTLWVLGTGDRSVPTWMTVDVLDGIRAAGNEAHTVLLFEGGDHSLRGPGGRPIEYRPRVVAWLEQQGILDR